MKRIPQLYSISDQGYAKDTHNPIYKLFSDLFDEILLQKTLDEDNIDLDFYVDSRSSEHASNENIMYHWTPTPVIIESSLIFKTAIKTSGLVYFLLGKKGIGKSTLLFHNIRMIKNNIDTLPIYLDLKSYKSDVSFHREVHDKIPKLIYKHIIHNELNFHEYLTDFNKLRSIDFRYKALPDETLSSLFISNPLSVLDAFFNFLKITNKQVYLVLDNIDDWPIKSINGLIDICVKLKSEFNIKCILALRDYWTPKNLNIDDVSFNSLLLTKPDFSEIINRRLGIISSKAIKQKRAKQLFIEINKELKPILITTEELINIYKSLVYEIHKEKQLQNDLFKLANCNTRDYILFIYYFFHSIYLSTLPVFEHILSKKINQFIPEFEIEPMREIKFRDFLKNNLAIHSHCLDIDNSRIFNIFYHKYKYREGEEFRSSLMFLRILGNVTLHSPFKINNLLQDLSEIGYPKEATIHALEQLIVASLIESPEGVSIHQIKDIFLSIKGEIYLTRVIYEFNYLLYISDAVPMPDSYKVSIKDKFGEEDMPFERGGSLNKKIEGVTQFISFLMEEENEEEKIMHTSKISILNRYKIESLFKSIDEEMNKTIQKLRQGNNYKRPIGEKIIQKIILK